MERTEAVRLTKKEIERLKELLGTPNSVQRGTDYSEGYDKGYKAGVNSNPIPKKTPTEAFYDLHKGKVCRTKGGYEAKLIAITKFGRLTLDSTAFEYVNCPVEDITHVKEESWVAVGTPEVS